MIDDTGAAPDHKLGHNRRSSPSYARRSGGIGPHGWCPFRMRGASRAIRYNGYSGRDGHGVRDHQGNARSDAEGQWITTSALCQLREELWLQSDGVDWRGRSRSQTVLVRS